MRKLLAIATMGLAAGPAPAADVYHWVDADGVAHYSQWAPPAGVEEVATRQIDATPAPGYDPSTDPYSITNQFRRIHAMWLDIEAIAAARRERAAGPGAGREAAEDSEYPERQRVFLLHPARPALPGRFGGKLADRQQPVLDEFQRLGARPAHSINSSVHSRRVELKAQAVENRRRQRVETHRSSNR